MAGVSTCSLAPATDWTVEAEVMHAPSRAFCGQFSSMEHSLVLCNAPSRSRPGVCSSVYGQYPAFYESKDQGLGAQAESRSSLYKCSWVRLSRIIEFPSTFNSHCRPSAGRNRTAPQNACPSSSSSVPVTHFAPDACNVDEIAPPSVPQDPSDSNGFALDDFSPLLTSVGNTFPIIKPPALLPTPNSRTALLRNLYYIVNTRRPLPNFPSLVDYHSMYPAFQSTHSHNLLIQLALRHRNYGIVQALFANLRDAALPRNLETKRLEVAWLVQTGRWDHAWKFVMLSRHEFPTPSGAIPFPIWLELCRTAIPRQSGGQHLPAESTEEIQRRHALLEEWRPVIPPLSSLSPFAHAIMTRLSLRAGYHERALSMTKAYLQAQPPKVKRSQIPQYLDIIHGHLSLSPPKRALAWFNSNCKLLKSLIKLQPYLRPSSRTLFLLLAPLEGTQKCGTLAWRMLSVFKARWGDRVEDSFVLRRICKFAMKEGRLDIAEKARRWGDHDLRARKVDRTEREVLGWPSPRKGHRRLPMSRLFPRNGQEAAKWQRLCAKLRRYARETKRESTTAT